MVQYYTSEAVKAFFFTWQQTTNNELCSDGFPYPLIVHPDVRHTAKSIRAVLFKFFFWHKFTCNGITALLLKSSHL